MRPDRRRDRRYIPSKAAYAALGAAYLKVGKIRDISTGGLGFEYLAEQQPDMESTEVTIFLMDDSFSTTAIACEEVYDFSSVSDASSDPVLWRRFCGVRFKAASAVEKAQIKHFLSNYVSASNDRA